MKTKQKLVLSLAALSAITLGVGATSTFAWFTTTRTATVAFTNASVYASKGNLQIAYGVVENGIKGEVDSVGNRKGSVSGNVLTVTNASTPVTDVSYDGTAFYKPIWTPAGEGTAASSIPAITNSATDSYFVQFNMILTNSGTKALNVYLDYGTTISGVTATGEDPAMTIQQGKNDRAAKATRVAINKGETLTNLFQTGTDANGYHFLSTTKGATSSSSKEQDAPAAYGVSTVFLNEVTKSTATKDFWHQGAFGTAAYTTEAEATDQTGSMIATLAENGKDGASGTFTVSIWIEGTATAAVNNTDETTIVGGEVNVNLALSAF